MSPSQLAAFARRDPHAVRAVYDEYGRTVYAVALRVLRRPDLAEEATQQTFVRAWQAADRLDLERDPAPWLATIAKRVALDIYRAESRRAARQRHYEESIPRVTEVPPDADRLDLAWAVREAIDELDPDEAAIVRMQHLQGLPQAEIARALGIPLGTVKSRSHRAHRKLMSALGHLRTERRAG
jgi:RNA polymerase sigma-70 factor (ECF subfamily)